MPMLNGFGSGSSRNFGFSRLSRIAPIFTNSSSVVFTAGDVWVNNAYQFTALGSTPITYSVYSGSLPPGITLASNGSLGGQIASNSYLGGSYPLIIKADNGVNPAAYQSFNLVVVDGVDFANAGSTLNIEHGVYVEIAPQVNYYYPVTGISYGATGLPQGLSINSSTGVISGTPIAAPGNYNFVWEIYSTDGAGSAGALFYVNIIIPSYTGITYTDPLNSSRTITKFDRSGYFYTGSRTNFDILMVGGGGAGGRGGGGGGSAVILDTITLNANTWYPVIIGGGGAQGGDAYWGWPYMSYGSDSSFAGLTAKQGGLGPCHGCNGNSGGSGSGGSFDGSFIHFGGVGVGPGIVSDGGDMLHPGGANAAAGGGGAGGRGFNTSSSSIAGNGGGGWYSTIDGYEKYYAGGGGGGVYFNGTVGLGGSGVGGNGAQGYDPSSPQGGNGLVNTGSGGGGGSGGSLSGNGGSGVLIIRYTT